MHLQMWSLLLKLINTAFHSFMIGSKFTYLHISNDFLISGQHLIPLGHKCSFGLINIFEAKPRRLELIAEQDSFYFSLLSVLQHIYDWNGLTVQMFSVAFNGTVILFLLFTLLAYLHSKKFNAPHIGWMFHFHFVLEFLEDFSYFESFCNLLCL